MPKGAKRDNTEIPEWFPNEGDRQWWIERNIAMPRGAKRDNTETAARNFDDERSFVSLEGHEYLYGRVDKEVNRLQIFGRAGGYCQLMLPGCRGFADWTHGEWDHIVSGLVGRCDCVGDGKTHGGRWVCKPCHRKRHLQLKWRKP